MAARIATGLLLAATLLTGCDDPHAGQMCAHHQTTTTFVMVGKVMVPVTTQHCVSWVNRP